MQSSPREIQVKTLVNGVDINADQSFIPLRLFGDRCLIEPIEPEKMLSEVANIAKPVDMKEPYRKGIIISVGGGEYGTTVPAELKVGLQVNYYHQQEVDFTVDKKVYKLIRISDVFAVL